MSKALLLDTHIALWLDSGSENLLGPTRSLIEDCWRTGGTIHFSAVSAWEIAVLVDKGFIELDIPTERWMTRFLERPGIAPVPLDHATAVRAYQLADFKHRDPGDRLLIASAIGLGCPLVTYDDRIRRFARSRGTRHGFSVASATMARNQ